MERLNIKFRDSAGNVTEKEGSLNWWINYAKQHDINDAKVISYQYQGERSFAVDLLFTNVTSIKDVISSFSYDKWLQFSSKYKLEDSTENFDAFMYGKIVYVSQPFAGRSEQEIQAERECMRKKLVSTLDKKILILDNFVRECDYENEAGPLIRGLQTMFIADLVYFAANWQEARGCRIEHLIAEEYHIPIMYCSSDDA